MFPYYYTFDIYYFVLVIPALLISLYAQYKVSSTFKKYSAVLNKRGITGAQVSEKILSLNGIGDVSVHPINGSLTDNYNPSKKTVNLSETVYGSTSVAALGVAAHETGHAIQHARMYFPLKLRTAIFPVVRFSSSAAVPLAVIGFISGFEVLVSVGIILFSTVVLFQLITLPVELNASRRAMELLDEYGIITEEESKITKKVLSAAAFTYLASALTGIANLLRLILLSRNRRR